MNRWLVLLVLLIATGLWWVITHLHDHLAITRPSGSRTAVVEGWLPRERIHDAAQLLVRGGYDRVYVTGTTRLFAYYLEQDQAVRVEFSGPVDGELMVNASGIDGGRLVLVNEQDTLMDITVSGTPTEYRTALPRGSRTLLLHSVHARALEPRTKNLFIKELQLDGTNVHALASTCTMQNADGSSAPAAPTFAEWGAWLLVEAGIPADRAIPVPAPLVGAGRTVANARAFATRAKADGITAADLFSLAVHARRSQLVYEEACGSTVRVGVIALKDPDTPRDGWWKNRLGLVRMLKELVGIPASEVLEGESHP